MAASAVIYVPIAVFCLAWLGYYLPSDELWSRLLGEGPLVGFLVGCCTGLALAGATQWATPRVAGLGRMANALSSQLGGLSPAACLLLALMSSVAEELLFRGLLQPGLGVVPATILFGLAHVPVERDLRAWPFMAAAVGALLAALFYWTGGLVAPIMAHFCLNAWNLIWLAGDQPRGGFRQ